MLPWIMLLSRKAPYFMHTHWTHLAGLRFGASIESLAQQVCSCLREWMC